MSRILTVSNIHGQYEKLQALLNKGNYNQGVDELVLLGDYICKGKKRQGIPVFELGRPGVKDVIPGILDDCDSLECLRYIISLQWLGVSILLGDYEAMLLEVLEEIENGTISHAHLQDGDDLTEVNGVALKLMSAPDAEYLVEYLKCFKEKCRIGKYIFSHAGYNPENSYEMQNSHSLLYAREDFLKRSIPDDIHVIFGHTPTRYLGCKNDMIYHGKNRTGIDCGSAFGGLLGLLIINEDGTTSEIYV